MLEFRIMFIDYKNEDSLGRDMEKSKTKAYELESRLMELFNIEAYVTPTMSSHGGYVTINFQADDKDIKKIFKLVKQHKPVSIRTEWRDA